jgi:hypothetical protein
LVNDVKVRPVQQYPPEDVPSSSFGIPLHVKASQPVPHINKSSSDSPERVLERSSIVVGLNDNSCQRITGVVIIVLARCRRRKS